MGQNRPVFLALRPEIFRKRGEHITLKYFRWTADAHYIYMWADALEFSPKLPVEVEVCGYANFKNGNEYFSVAMIERFKEADFWWSVQFPHITMQKSRNPLPSPVFHGDEQLSDTVDKLWFGRSNGNGDYDWFPFEKDGYDQFVAWLG